MRARLCCLLVVVVGVLGACGGDSTSTPGTTTVKFVGNGSCPTDNASPYSPSPPNTNSAPVGQPIDEMPHSHVNPPTKVDYLHSPPTSGCHYNLGTGVAPISQGIHPPTPAIAPEYWVHNLEHGYIVVTYNCTKGCDSDLQALTKWYQALPPDPSGAVPYAKAIAVPYPQQKEKFDVLSWDWFDPLGSTLNITEIQRFYDNHINQAPEGVQTP